MDNQVHVIALKTLKQRCEYLQERLKAVEEENCKLKLEMTQDLNKKVNKEAKSLEEQIVILNKEKSHMTHQIQMILKENFTLWSHLSKLLPGSNISSLKFSVPADEDNGALKFSQYDNISYDCNRESLEEISLKLINGIIMGKNELEKQYSQMIDLHKENIPEQNSSFLPKKMDSSVAVKNLKDYVQKLKDFKQTLFLQKNDLSNAITIIKKSGVFTKDHVRENQKDVLPSLNREHDVVNQTDFEFLTLQEPEISENRNENFGSSEMVCPMCGKTFTGQFKDFYKHVSDHFDNENDEFFDGRGNFEGVQ